MEKSYKHNYVGVKYVGPAEIIVYKEFFKEWKEECYYAKVTTLAGEKATEVFRIPSSTCSKSSKEFIRFCNKYLGKNKEHKFKEKVQIDSWTGLTIPSIGMKDCYPSQTKNDLANWR